MPVILSLLEIHLMRPLCEHRAVLDGSPWRLEIMPTKMNGEPTYGFRIWCSICGAEDSIPICRFEASFDVDGRPYGARKTAAELQEFTKEDKRFLKSMKIQVED